MGGAIVHEWISQAGGSENVLEAMSQMYPDADIHCLWNDSVGRFAPERIHETWLSRTPLRRSKALALPFMPAVWRSLDNNDYEWALISSHLFAHHARFNNQSDDLRRFVYVHTPARYIWDPALDLRGNSAAVRAVASTFKPIDRRRANEPASFAAMREYSPYDNTREAAYPPILATAGLNDPRVSYWEPAKWVARLREMNQHPSEILLKINMGAGHFGASGRYDRIEEVAFEFAWLLKTWNLI